MNEHFEQEFAASADKRRNWGFALLFAAGIIWVVLAYQLMMPFSDGDDYAGSRKCESMVFYEGDAPTWVEAETREECRAKRRWPEMLGWLGLSVPLSVAGAALYTSGTTSLRMREYMAQHRIATAKATEKAAAKAAEND